MRVLRIFCVSTKFLTNTRAKGFTPRSQRLNFKYAIAPGVGRQGQQIYLGNPYRPCISYTHKTSTIKIIKHAKDLL